MEYANKINVSADTETCFKAVSNEIAKWWGKVDNTSSKVGDEFSVYFGKTEWRFKITEFIPFELISWHCIKAVHVHGDLTNIEKEWLNTKLLWKFKAVNSNSEISFVHRGLTPGLNCYDVCKNGWDFSISISLKEYLETGEGKPSL